MRSMGDSVRERIRRRIRAAAIVLLLGGTAFAGSGCYDDPHYYGRRGVRTGYYASYGAPGPYHGYDPYYDGYGYGPGVGIGVSSYRSYPGYYRRPYYRRGYDGRRGYYRNYGRGRNWERRGDRDGRRTWERRGRSDRRRGDDRRGDEPSDEQGGPPAAQRQ